MIANSNPELVREFLDAFEEVFDSDWAYTKQMLGITSDTEEQKAACKEMGLETISIISDGGTFIHPKIHPKVGDEVEDWGNRGRLLAAYRALKKSVS